MKRHLIIATATAALAGCSLTVPMPTYAPANVAEISGTVEVDAFDYTPAHPVPADAVYNTGPGTLRLSQPVAEYVGSAVGRELRQAGISLQPGRCKLTGSIADISIDDTGFAPVRYDSEIAYRMADRAGALLFDRTYRHEFTTGKQLEPSALATYLAQLVSGNIGQMMADPTFKDAVTAHCRP